MTSLLARLFCAFVILTCTSCVVGVMECPGRPYYTYQSNQYFPSHAYRHSIITPVAHGFDPDPQYVCHGSWIFRNTNDGMIYSIR
jgi:hypothetical protein